MKSLHWSAAVISITTNNLLSLAEECGGKVTMGSPDRPGFTKSSRGTYESLWQAPAMMPLLCRSAGSGELTREENDWWIAVRRSTKNEQTTADAYASPSRDAPNGGGFWRKTFRKTQIRRIMTEKRGYIHIWNALDNRVTTQYIRAHGNIREAKKEPSGFSA